MKSDVLQPCNRCMCTRGKQMRSLFANFPSKQHFVFVTTSGVEDEKQSVLTNRQAIRTVSCRRNVTALIWVLKNDKCCLVLDGPCNWRQLMPAKWIPRIITTLVVYLLLLIYSRSELSCCWTLWCSIFHLCWEPVTEWWWWWWYNGWEIAAQLMLIVLKRLHGSFARVSWFAMKTYSYLMPNCLSPN